MRNDTVACNRLGNPDSMRRTLDEKGLDTTMLVAQGNLKVQNLFAPAEKSEMTRLNHPCMHRPDTNLMENVTMDSEKRVPFDSAVALGTAVVTMVPSFSPYAMLVLNPSFIKRPHRLEPGMMPGYDPELLIQFTLKDVHGRNIMHHGDILRGRLHKTARHQELGP